MHSLAAMIASRVDAYTAQLDDPNLREALSETNCRRDPASTFEEGILRPLEALLAPSGGTRYLLFDALDEGLALSEPGLNVVQLLATRIDRMPGWLRIVATTRKEPEVLSRLKGLRRRELDAQDSRNLADLERYIAARLETPNLAQALTESQVPKGRVIETLKQKSEGNFLYVRQALEGIERGSYRLDELDRLPPGLFGLYQSFFERTFPDKSSFAGAVDSWKSCRPRQNPSRRQNSPRPAAWIVKNNFRGLCNPWRSICLAASGRGNAELTRCFTNRWKIGSPIRTAEPSSTRSAASGAICGWPLGCGHNTHRAPPGFPPIPGATSRAPDRGRGLGPPPGAVDGSEVPGIAKCRGRNLFAGDRFQQGCRGIPADRPQARILKLLEERCAGTSISSTGTAKITRRDFSNACGTVAGGTTARKLPRTTSSRRGVGPNRPPGRQSGAGCAISLPPGGHAETVRRQIGPGFARCGLRRSTSAPGSGRSSAAIGYLSRVWCFPPAGG